MRCRRETPPPVIQVFRPLITQRSPRLTAVVVISVAAEPASGSVMQMAGLSPASTSPAASFRCASVP